MSRKPFIYVAAMAIPLGLLLAPAGTVGAQAADREADMKGIWGAIAYSTSDEQVGIFWGADKKAEAEENALRHCRNTRGADCQVVSVFRNYRGSRKDDGGFPYHRCGALAVGVSGASGAMSAPSRAQAEEKSLDRCGGDEKQCKIREWVCT